MLELDLPYPPSVNHYWRHFRGRTVISRDAVRGILHAMQVQPMSGPLAVHIEVFPPDRRRRDLDNLLKAIGDALEHGGAFHDDSQIVWLLVEKAQVMPKTGKVHVRITEKQ
jgi:crossover junction endodeoxyribonuclease RusA